MGRIFLALCAGAMMAGCTMPAVVDGTGLRAVSARMQVDAAASPDQIVQITAHVAAARARTAQALGAARADPQVVVCVTTECDAAQGLSTRGLSFADRWLKISSRAWDHGPTYTHEWVHIEMHRADLLLARARFAVPIWFDEGAATLVSGTVGADLSAAECAGLAGLSLPVAQDSFGAFTKQQGFRRGYGAAACRVKDWLAAGHRMRDVLALMRRGALPR